MDKIKIVRIITRLNIGGPAIHTILLSSALNSSGYKDILVTGQPSKSEGNMIDLAKNAGLEPILLPELGREISVINDAVSLFSIYRILKKEKPDIVHTHTAKAGALGRIAAIVAGVPVKIHTFHGHIFDGYFSPVKARAFLFIEKVLARFTDVIIVISEKVREEIADKLRIVRKEKCAIIELGLDLERFLENGHLKGNFRRKFNIANDALLIGIVGRLVPIKNHKMFLEVAKNIQNKHIGAKVKFVIAGDGELKGELTAHAKKLGLENAVLFLGWIDDLPSLYADLDIVVLTSLNEGTPLSLIEAMVSSKPVVSTDVGGVRDVIVDGENGLLARDGDVEDFSLKLLELLMDKNKRILFGERGRKLAEKKYFKDRLINDIENLYNKCLLRKGASSSRP